MAAELKFQAIIDLSARSCARCSTPKTWASAGSITRRPAEDPVRYRAREATAVIEMELAAVATGRAVRRAGVARDRALAQRRRVRSLGDRHRAGHRHEPVGLATPIFVSDRLLGFLSLENHERDKAFATPMSACSQPSNEHGVALDNARLFDETQRLLKEPSSATPSWRSSTASSRAWPRS